MRKIYLSLAELIVLIQLTFILGLLTMYIAPSLYVNTASSVSNSKFPNCTSSDLFDTANCLKEQVATFYKYNISNIGKYLKFEQLKEEGGVCRHYADWYYQNINSSLFEREEIIISGESPHQFTIMSNKQGYCILDQLAIGCIPYANSTKEAENEK